MSSKGEKMKYVFLMFILFNTLSVLGFDAFDWQTLNLRDKRTYEKVVEEMGDKEFIRFLLAGMSFY